MHLSRSETVIVALAAGGIGAAFDPVRIQKLLFLVDREVPGLIRGGGFNFKPFHFGPFDKAVYKELEDLVHERYVEIDRDGPYPLYSLTQRGQSKGEILLAKCDDAVKSYVERAAQWVLCTSFGRLVEAIYKRYPEMAARSKMRSAKSRYRYPAVRSRTHAFIRGFGRAFDVTGNLDEGQSTWLDPTSDAAAIHSDWAVVGDSLQRATRAIK